MSATDPKAEIVAFHGRWKCVRIRELEELRQSTPSEKLRLLAALMASVKQLGWQDQLREEDESVRMRWDQLRKAYLG